MVWFAGGCAGLFTSGSGDHTVPGRKSAEAIKLMEDYKYPESIAAFQKIVEEYPKSDWEANSIYSIATAYITAENPHKDYAQALIHFEKFLSLYPKHERAADARNWRQAVKMIIDSKKENERLLKNIEKLKQLDMRQEQKRLGR
jgi:outer membrane protein assembly factor BamD (BamD/ComL family)